MRYLDELPFEPGLKTIIGKKKPKEKDVHFFKIAENHIEYNGSKIYPINEIIERAKEPNAYFFETVEDCLKSKTEPVFPLTYKYPFSSMPEVVATFLARHQYHTIFVKDGFSVKKSQEMFNLTVNPK